MVKSNNNVFFGIRIQPRIQQGIKKQMQTLNLIVCFLSLKFCFQFNCLSLIFRICCPSLAKYLAVMTLMKLIFLILYFLIQAKLNHFVVDYLCYRQILEFLLLSYLFFIKYRVLVRLYHFSIIFVLQSTLQQLFWLQVLASSLDPHENKSSCSKSTRTLYDKFYHFYRQHQSQLKL